MPKPKVAFYWCSSCGGCEEAIIDLNEEILDVTSAVDIVFWPVALDFKKKDVKAFKDGELAVCFINGAIRTDEQKEMVELLRRKSNLVIAFGSCAHIGGIPGLANFSNRDEIFDKVYKTTLSTDNTNGLLPQTKSEVDGCMLTLPEFWNTVNTLDQVIDVDYYLPGCAPPADLIMEGIKAILENELPERGAVLSPEKPLCDTCPRAESKPEKISVKKIVRPHETICDPEKCFLEEGLICFGPATRSGCGERCISANMPCRGCFGPVDGVEDQGARVLSAVASVLNVEDEENLTEDEVQQLIDQINDPAGLFYMYSLPSSLLKRKKLD
jgi:F420-non-reducing hydrogenase small subunit